MQINPSTGNEREIRLQGSQPVVEMPKLNFKRLMVELLACEEKEVCVFRP